MAAPGAFGVFLVQPDIYYYTWLDQGFGGRNSKNVRGACGPLEESRGEGGCAGGVWGGGGPAPSSAKMHIQPRLYVFQLPRAKLQRATAPWPRIAHWSTFGPLSFSNKSVKKRAPLAAAGPHFDHKGVGVVWSTDTKMKLNLARSAATRSKTPPKCTCNHVCMCFSCPEQHWRLRQRRGLAMIAGVLLVQ